MKIVIMAGGYATRLWPITRKRSKSLLPIGKETIIDHVYSKIAKFNLPVIVSTNQIFEEDFKKWAKNKGIQVIAEKTTKEEEKLGAVKALGQLYEILNDDSFIIGGDNLFRFGLEQFYEYFKKNKKPLTALYDVKAEYLAKRYGIAELEEDKIVKFHEKSDNPPSTLAGMGIYILPRKSLNILLEYIEKGRNVDNLGDYISYLAEKDEIYAFPCHEGLWHDIGKPDSYLESLSIYMKKYIGNIEIDENSKIIEPVVIKDNSKIINNSIIGPNVYIDENCTIDNSKISNSVIFDNSSILNSQINKSILDSHCSINDNKLKDSVLGEYSKINEH